MGTDLKTLFQHAPSEMSHSGFWAWFFECHKAVTGPRARLRAAARRVITCLAPSGTTFHADENCSVETEVPVDSGRLDIEIRCDAFSIVIENKVAAQISDKQLARYQETVRAARPNPVSFVIMSLALDEDTRSTVPEGWRYVGLDKMLSWLAPTGGKHAITDEYLQYLRAKKQERKRLEDDAFSSCKATYEHALGEDWGQWAWMKRFEGTAGLVGWPLKGRNRDGSPWTQYWINGQPDHLFFRLDRARAGFYLALLQHDKSGATQARREALANLRGRWLEAADAAGIDLKMSKLTRGKMNLKIAQYDFAENGGPASVVEKVSRLFRAFIDQTPEYSMASNMKNVPVGDTR